MVTYGGSGFTTPLRLNQRLATTSRIISTKLSLSLSPKTSYIKTQLAEYLQTREQLNADEAAQSEVGRVIGGTRGNAILDYVSGGPNRPSVIENAPELFDYDELEKYGYGHLVKDIMDHLEGGRLGCYELMGMTVPPSILARKGRERKGPRTVKIDRKGENDEVGFGGLGFSTVMDDDVMGRQLDEIARRKREGLDSKETNKSSLKEEPYVMPFADKRNTSPMGTPTWTAQQLDEEGKRTGQRESWARSAKAALINELVGDTYENMNIEGSTSLLSYSMSSILFASFAYGNASVPFLTNFLHWNAETAQSLLEFLHLPAFVLILSSLGSSIACAVLAPSKKRASIVWAVKGLAAGPLALNLLMQLDSLKTQKEWLELKEEGNYDA